MVQDLRWDAVIAGGGLSGLSLAAHLAKSGWGGRRVLMVDDGAHDVRARSWAFWSSRPGVLDAASGRSFDRVHLHADRRDLLRSIQPYTYRVVGGADLRVAVDALTAGCPGFELREGHVSELVDLGDHAVVVVDGRPVESAWAFDSVLAPLPQSRVTLSFDGWEVETEPGVFDPTTPTLMDFRTPQHGGVRFVYVLPVSTHRALVEHTQFGSEVAPNPEGVPRYLKDVLGVESFSVLRREAGVLPLPPRFRPAGSGRVIPIGSRGGLLKASTGYAYARIQRDSAAIAQSLVQDGHPFGRPRTRARHRFLDSTLLELVRTDPRSVEVAFAELFRRNPADLVLRFLDEDTSVTEEVRLLRTLPRRPFLRAAASRTGLLGRGGSWRH